jgi:hypothetical protein
VGRYIQQISLVPFSTTELWVGWELEGVEGEIDGLRQAGQMTEIDLARLGVYEFQVIPEKYLHDMKRENDGRGVAGEDGEPEKRSAENRSERNDPRSQKF